MKDFTLEKHRFFPYVAWALSIGFALFVGNLALQLQTVTEDLAAQNELLEYTVHNNTLRIDELEQTVNEVE